MPFKGYRQIYAAPMRKGERVAWFRPGSRIKVNPDFSNPDWLQIQLPSLRTGFVPARDAKA